MVHGAKTPNVVVFPLKATGVSEGTANAATERLRILLHKSGRIRVVERNEIDNILKTIGTNLDDCTEEGCGIEMGRQLNADNIVTGTITKAGKTITITANLIDLETTQRKATDYHDIPNAVEDQVITYIPLIVNKLASQLPLIGNVQEVAGDQIMVDLGSANGVGIGQELLVENIREFQNVRTGENQTIADEVGKIKVVKLSGTEYIYCTPQPGCGKLTAGMQVRVENANILPVPQGMQPTPQPGGGASPTPTAERATLQVSSDPSGADVYLDGDPLGKTPLTKSNLETGDHSLTVSKAGFVTNSQMVRLTSAQPKVVSIDLPVQTGDISITTEPSGATVSLDGVSLGVFAGKALTQDKLKMGKHTVKAVLEGYEDAEQSVTVEYNKTATVTLRLKGKPGAIFVSTTPAGAGLVLDGKPVAQKSNFKIENVPHGVHTVRIALTGYDDIEKTVTVAPGKTVTVNEVMKATPKPEPVIAGGSKQSGQLSIMKFVQIPGGSFMMGSIDYDSEKPVHRVTVQPFKMQTTEVTQAQWVAVMGSNPSWGYGIGDNYPVYNVSWNDCQQFIDRLNRLNPGKGYRLPTEAEWEYACRGGTSTKYYAGDSGSELAQVGWYSGNSERKTNPVGQKTPNAWGLYDMHGNVWEWCQDVYHNSYNGALTDGSVWERPGGNIRIMRGGAWGYGSGFCRSAYRYGGTPEDRNNDYGFRLVCR